jgi:hypothetical protein
MEAAEQRLANLPRSNVRHITDHEGLYTAYGNVNKVTYIPSNGSMYIAGTQTYVDVADWRYVPFNQIQNSTMYKRADRIASINNAAGIDRFIGHSMGALVAKALGEKYNKPYVMYGAPVVTNPISTPGRYRRYASYANFGDPVSILDFQAQHQFGRYWNPHSY